MKRKNTWRENLSLVLSAALALAVFLVLLAGFNWNPLICVAFGAAVYLGAALLFRPVEKIGKVEVSELANGEALHAKLNEAGTDYERMKKAVSCIGDQKIQRACIPLLETARSILTYLTENPEKIPSARRYIDYYQETAANVLEHYVELNRSGLATGEAAKVRKNTEEAVSTLNGAFQMQLEKLMQNELMDMEADLKLLKQTLKSEGWTEPGETEKTKEKKA